MAGDCTGMMTGICCKSGNGFCVNTMRNNKWQLLSLTGKAKAVTVRGTVTACNKWWQPEGGEATTPVFRRGTCRKTETDNVVDRANVARKSGNTRAETRRISHKKVIAYRAPDRAEDKRGLFRNERYGVISFFALMLYIFYHEKR